MIWVCYFTEWTGIDVTCSPDTGGKPGTLHQYCQWKPEPATTGRYPPPQRKLTRREHHR